MEFPFNLAQFYIQASLFRLLLWWRSPRVPSAGGTLHTTCALRSAFGWWCLRQWRSNSTPLGRPTVSPASLLADDPSFSKLCSLSLPEVRNYTDTTAKNLVPKRNIIAYRPITKIQHQNVKIPFSSRTAI